MMPDMFQTGPALIVVLLVSLARPASPFSFMISSSKPDCITVNVVPMRPLIASSPTQV
jgi:hypothetical protein